MSDQHIVNLNEMILQFNLIWMNVCLTLECSSHICCIVTCPREYFFSEEKTGTKILKLCMGHETLKLGQQNQRSTDEGRRTD